MDGNEQPKVPENPGKCSQCTDPCVEGRSRCRKHLDKANELARSRNALRKAHGMCLRCPNVAKQGHVLCEDCLEGLRGRDTNVGQKLERETGKLRARKAAGICRWCPEPIYEGRSLCKGHLESQRKKVREYRAERKAAGLCWRCDDPARPKGGLCQRHRDEVTKKERARSSLRASLSGAGQVPQKVHPSGVAGSNGEGTGKVGSSEAVVPVIERGFGIDPPPITNVVDFDGVKFAAR
jgi:hypothetical protein